MPDAQCPKCSVLFHIYTANEAAWYRENCLDMQVGEGVSELCFDCWKSEYMGKPPDEMRQD